METIFDHKCFEGAWSFEGAWHRSPPSDLFATQFFTNHNNYRAVWTSCFFKVRFSMEIGLISVLCCVSLCYVLYSIFITLLYKTSVNVKPLTTPVFEEFAAYLTTLCLFSFVCLRLRFRFFSYWCWFPNTPRRPPGPDWLHFGSMLMPFWLQKEATKMINLERLP